MAWINKLGGVLRRGAAVRFVRLQGGSIAVEAALIAPAFIFLVSIATERAAMMLSMRALDNAVDAAARNIRVGNPDVRSGSAAGFRQLICNNMPAFTKCNDNLVVQVVSSPQFGTLATALARANQTVATPTFNPGLPSSYVAVEATYTWDVITPSFFVLPARETFSTRTVFRNEPFDRNNIGAGS